MRAYISLDPLRRCYEVRLARRAGDRTHYCANGLDDYGVPTWVSVGDNEDAPVLLRLDPDALEAIVREATGVFPATEPTARHLDDAIKIRDRLLDVFVRPPEDNPA